MKRVTFSLILMTLSTTAIADSETYILDNNHTLPRFSYNHLGYSNQLSRFDRVSGKIIIDLKAKAGTVEVSIDTTSVSTGSAKFNEHIQGEDYFDTKKYPTATFNSSKLIFDGERLSSVEGTLTLKGISKPVSLTVISFHCMFHPVLMKNACGANANTVIKRSDFNMGKYVPLVGDEVTITIPVEAVKQ